MFENWDDKDFAKVEQRASSTTVGCHAFIVEYLDRQHGAGFAAAHSELVASLTQSAATRSAGEMLARAVDFGLRKLGGEIAQSGLGVEGAIKGRPTD